METPKSQKQKTASRLAEMGNKKAEIGSDTDNQIPHYSVSYVASPSPPLKPRKTPSSTPSKLSINKPRNFIPLHEHLLLSPSPSPVRDGRRCKTRTSSNGFAASFSPRNLRRSRRRTDQEERDFEELLVKPRKRRNSAKSKKDKIHSAPSSREESALDGVGELIWELIMWRDVAKSSLWFGFGCLSFLSCCFTKGFNISLLSVISQLGLLCLAASFIANSMPQSANIPRNLDWSLKEDDILRLIRVFLPSLNLLISKTRELFSGEPSMTLKVALFLLVGAEYGHLLTLWRLFALGFFTTFTAPKLYISYAAQIHTKAEKCKLRVSEAWRACYHKKIFVGSAATAFWNLSTLKTRILAAFIALVILRYYQQLSGTKLEEESTPMVVEVEPQKQAEREEPQSALVLADGNSDNNKLT